MKKAVDVCVLSAFVFMIFLFILPLFAASGGVIYAMAYVLSFSIAALAACILARSLDSRGGIRIGIRIDGVRLFLPFLLPTVGAVMLVSALTSFVMSLFGFSNALALSGSLPELLVLYALIPAVGEEVLFRYLPIKFISPHSRKCAVLVSALLFSLIHTSLFQIPYAFLAGVVFAVLDIACESVLPSVAIHLANNVLSIMIGIYATETWLRAVCALLALLTAVSVGVMIFKRARYKREIGAIFSHGTILITLPLVLFAAVSLFISALNLL